MNERIPPHFADPGENNHIRVPWHNHTTQELGKLCAQHTSRRGPPTPGLDPCYELFCRAFDDPPDEAAWQAVLKQYQKLILLWLGQHGSQDTCQQVFINFWKAQNNADAAFAARFPHTSAVMEYLKCCALTVRIATHRAKKKQEILQERLERAARAELLLARTRQGWSPTHFDLKQLVSSRLNDEQERVVFEATYQRGLPPREIQAERPDLFPDTRRVHRVKENLLKRLGRDPALQAYWSLEKPKDDDVGKTNGPSI
jgi:hypothetical protein